MRLPPAILCIAAIATAVQAQVTFTDLGAVPGWTESDATAVSRDGQVVAGFARDAGGAHGFRWTTLRGHEDLGLLPGVPHDDLSVTAISDDGTVIIGQIGLGIAGIDHGFRWVAGRGMEDLGAINHTTYSNYTLPLDVSGDGQTVVGQTNDGAFIWKPETGMRRIVGLGSAEAISRDGRFVAGDRARRVNLATGEIVDIGTDFYVWAISDDGAAVVGATFVAPAHPVKWRNGIESSLSVPDGFSGYSYTCNLDASVVAGNIFDRAEGSESACFWVGSSQPVNLQTFLLARGIELSNWSLRYVSGVSANGAVLIGGAYHGDEFSRAWMVTLGPVCTTADYDHDGDVGTDADIEAFFRCLAGNCCSMCYTRDLNDDGDEGTDRDIETFFRVLAGGSC